ncbi:hypothetical protein, partial [Streptococcus sobrinus]
FGRNNATMNDLYGQPSAKMTAHKERPKKIEPLLVTIEYINGDIEEFELNDDQNDTIKMFSDAMSANGAMIFPNGISPFVINANHIKKVTVDRRDDDD